MKSIQYQSYIHDLCRTGILKPHRNTLCRLSELDMECRSAVAKLCRAQCYPPKSTRLYKMVKCLPPDLLRDLLPLCQTSLMAGLVLQCVLLAPMSSREIARIYTESLTKEVSVMESIRRECSINFEPFFGSYGDSICDHIPPNPTIAKRIHGMIDEWIQRTRETLLIPRVGSKTVSRMTQDEIPMVDSTYVADDGKGYTPIDVERVYYRTGTKVGGPCEMRQKWYSSNLKPRTYYAMGGDAYHSSKYLANALTDLCDQLPSTNRRTRVNPGRLELTDFAQDVAFYDLTSFTSNLHVHATFMYRLALYCRGVTVDILDSCQGIIQVDLGELLYEYTAVNLDNPSYVLPKEVDNQSGVRYHNIAGFLGVYGNISSATFIHGIVMAMLYDNLNENNVAGDDGVAASRDNNETLSVIGLLGVIKDEKTFWASEGCCIHLKRPITRNGQRLVHGSLVTWPSLEIVQDDVDMRYPYIRRVSKSDKRSALASSILAFLRNLESRYLSDEELDVVDRFLTSIYDTYSLPREGCVPQVTPSSHGFIPAYERRYIGLDPLRNTLLRHYSDTVRLPVRGIVEYENGMLRLPCFRCNRTKILGHLVVLGILEQEKQHELTYGQEGRNLLLKEYCDPEPVVYVYTVLCKLPVWVEELLIHDSI